jgi:hypothetical protein
MNYICEKCDKVFTEKRYYDQHLKKKLPCNSDELAIYKANKCKCEYCHDKFASVQSVHKHMEKCTKKPSEIEELKQLIADLKNQVTTLSVNGIVNNGVINNVTNNNVTNNNNSNNTLVQIIVPYGNEDLSFLTVNDYKRIFKKGCFSIPELISMVHCNEAHPECMNIYIKNLKDDYILIYDGNEWMIKEKTIIFDNILMKKKVFLEDKFDDYYDQLSFVEKQLFKKFLERYDVDEVINNIKLELKMLLYNNRKAIPKKPVKKNIKQITNATNENNLLEDIQIVKDKINAIVEEPENVDSNEKKPKKKTKTK